MSGLVTEQLMCVEAIVLVAFSLMGQNTQHPRPLGLSPQSAGSKADIEWWKGLVGEAAQPTEAREQESARFLDESSPSQDPPSVTQSTCQLLSREQTPVWTNALLSTVP